MDLDQLIAPRVNYREERILRLLDELRHEVTRGVLEGEITERFSYGFLVPRSKEQPNGVVEARFETRPTRWPIYDVSYLRN